ncbi:unnamed protein product [Lasius platythorax]|uniref:Uncharacterized protein n=1 Tax=Lasius platythorax TaxID=488582 RepID=A0AAV2P325_9HYME
MIMGLRYWERLESTMTGEFANRLMALARRDAITIHRTLSVTLVCSALSLTKPAMIAVITPNCLMAGKWMIIVLERHERECLRGADSPSFASTDVVVDLCLRFVLERREKDEIARRWTRVPFAQFTSPLAPESI